jgi:hypothetical protein
LERFGSGGSSVWRPYMNAENRLRWDPSKLHFEFSLPNRETRFKELYIYVAKMCGEDNSAVKQAKIMFFSDFEAFAVLGTPITGMPYSKFPQGPYPKAGARLREEMLRDKEIKFEKRRVHKFHREYAVPLREPDRTMFSKDELAIVDKWITFFRNKTSDFVSNYSHGKAWKIASQGDPIPYEAAFISDEPVTPSAVDKVKELGRRFGWDL